MGNPELERAAGYPRVVTDDHETPAERAAALRAIRPEQAHEHHDELRAIFRAESEQRVASGNPEYLNEYFENLYWCAFLLYEVGDPSDVPMMCATKFDTDFDTACGFDVQFLFGAGPVETLEYLRHGGRDDLANDLEKYLPDVAPDELQRWREFRRNYFYPV
jgi:hypothetical protein